MNVKILVVAHKPYRMPEEDIYLPIQVGGALTNNDFGFQRDDDGINISNLNRRFNELTAIYWAWKNLNADYVGLVHYRRHFSTRRLRVTRNKWNCIILRDELEDLLNQYDLILPQKRKYFIETMKSHFMHRTLDIKNDYKIVENIIWEMYPEYIKAFYKVMSRSWAHMFNVFVMKRNIFDAYCEWLFPILFELDKRIQSSNSDRVASRSVALYAEIMIDVWLEMNPQKYCELPVLFMEKQNLVLKTLYFLKRKFIRSF